MTSINDMQYVIELDSTSYRCSRDKLEQISDFRDLEGDLCLFSDFGGAVSRTMSVEAPYKYADVMIRKSLQETGEFDEPLSVITHWKKKKGTNTTDAFFTAVPTRLYHMYRDRSKVYNDNSLLFPIYSVLYGVLKRMKFPHPAAVVFQHGRFAELIIGTRDDILYAERCVAFDDSEEQISSLWNMVTTEIQQVERENHIRVEKVFLLTWIDTHSRPEWPEDAGSELCYMDEEPLIFEGETYSSSFFKAARMMSGHESASGPVEKISYYSLKTLPFLSTFLLLGVLLFFSAYFWYAYKAEQIGTDLNALTTQISELQQRTEISEVDYQDSFAFVRELDRYRKIPSFKQILEDISSSLPEEMSLDVLKVDYSGNILDVEVYTKVESLFDTAYKGYQRFLSLMKQKGYIIDQSDFNTSIQESNFLATFKKKI
ncbi:MAG: hypothetical protein GY864_12570 [Desulfobacterales bacterium]|nr:hypothetical protein [Desulfobacterales bacterium]